MGKHKIVSSTDGGASGTIEELMEFLKGAKKKGATHYKMRWSGDPIWSFKWFEAYKIMTEEEVNQKEIEKLQNRIEELKSK